MNKLLKKFILLTGKTLQSIALVWTLAKQGPYGSPIAKRTLLVAPSGLIKQWTAEVTKWLGSYRILIYVVDAKKRPVEKYLTECPSHRPSIMFVSYDMFVRNAQEVQYSKSIH